MPPRLGEAAESSMLLDNGPLSIRAALNRHREGDTESHDITITTPRRILLQQPSSYRTDESTCKVADPPHSKWRKEATITICFDLYFISPAASWMHR